MIKKILIIVLALPFLVIGAAYLLPNETTVTRSIVIEKPVAEVFPALNDFRNFQTWSPWAEKDPDAVVEFEGPVNSGGAKMTWKSKHPEVGYGSQEIVESQVNKYVEMKLNFNGQPEAKTFFELEEIDLQKTKVTWGFVGNHGENPMMRYMGLMFDEWLGKDYERGLNKLKDVIENQKIAEEKQKQFSIKNVVEVNEKGEVIESTGTPFKE